MRRLYISHKHKGLSDSRGALLRKAYFSVLFSKVVFLECPVYAFFFCSFFICCWLAFRSLSSALLSLSLAIPGAFLSLLDFSHQYRVPLFDVMPLLCGRLIIRAVPLSSPCLSFFLVHFAKRRQIR